MEAEAQDGFATPAAAVISLALSVVVAATITRGLAELKLAKAELARSQAEARLDGAQSAALVMMSTSTRPPPYRWTVASLGDAIDVVAEPERPKMNPSAAATATDDLLATLGATDLAATRARLGRAGDLARLKWVADSAASALWRRCAPAYISPFGAAAAPAAPAAPTYSEPLPTQQTGLWRAGEVWRISVMDRAGWRDERIVRFTGNGLDPVAVLGRRFTKDLKGQQTCEALFAAPSAA